MIKGNTLEREIFRDGKTLEKHEFECDGEQFENYIKEFEGLRYSIVLNENREIISTMIC